MTKIKADVSLYDLLLLKNRMKFLVRNSVSRRLSTSDLFTKSLVRNKTLISLF